MAVIIGAMLAPAAQQSQEWERTLPNGTQFRLVAVRGQLNDKTVLWGPDGGSVSADFEEGMLQRFRLPPQKGRTLLFRVVPREGVQLPAVFLMSPLSPVALGRSWSVTSVGRPDGTTVSLLALNLPGASLTGTADLDLDIPTSFETVFQWDRRSHTTTIGEGLYHMRRSDPKGLFDDSVIPRTPTVDLSILTRERAEDLYVFFVMTDGREIQASHNRTKSEPWSLIQVYQFDVKWNAIERIELRIPATTRFTFKGVAMSPGAKPTPPDSSSWSVRKGA
ncbi:MAG: hypothetical protein KF884_07195 [Fimbriimonadaceae bacterium]|nr:hypothetical protein [Fimbriimonadaceae bacterium]QYK57335.1 MAG: hypothetical protein KF884_07195 [Fimbriimonadaceae bacterium]